MSTSPGPEPTRARSHRGRTAGRDRRSSSGGPFAGGAGERRRSRERALELAYEAEQKGLDPVAVLAELPVRPADYTVVLVSGLSERLAEVDELVAGHSTGWAIERMPAVDRCIIRLATYELLSELDVPVAVVIDEAVELAKEYSTEDSARFVNGVLAAIAATVGAEAARATATRSRPASALASLDGDVASGQPPGEGSRAPERRP